MARTSTTRVLGMLALLALVSAACGGSTESDFRSDLSNAGLNDQMIDCLVTELGDRGIELADISDQALGDNDLPEDAQDAFVDCALAEGSGLADSDTTDSGATGSGSSDTGSSGSTDAVDTYGDDPELDALWDACENGDGAACDDLFFQSPIGSDYEDFGNTCGRRFAQSPGFCEDAI